jgi:hypothetical protein
MIGHVSAHQITPLQIHALHNAWKARLSPNTLNQYVPAAPPSYSCPCKPSAEPRTYYSTSSERASNARGKTSPPPRRSGQTTRQCSALAPDNHPARPRRRTETFRRHALLAPKLRRRDAIHPPNPKENQRTALRARRRNQRRKNRRGKSRTLDAPSRQDDRDARPRSPPDRTREKKGSHGRKRGATTTEKTNRAKTMNTDQFNRMFDKSVHLSSKTPTCSGDRCWCGLCHCARCQKGRRETSEASK